MRRIFQMHDQEIGGDAWEGKECKTLTEAIREAQSKWDHLTDAEKKGREIFVAEYTIPDECNTLNDYMDSDEAPMCLEWVRTWERDSLDFRKIRERSGLTQKGFSEKYGIPMRTVQSWEIGEREPAEYVCELLARVVFDDFHR